MAILSPSIRRSLHQLLARTSSSKPLTNANNAASLRIGTQVISRRAVHATSVVSGDALDMADTFSRRHGAFVFDVYVLCISCAHFFLSVHITCTLLIAIISLHTPSHLLYSLHHKTIIIYL